MDSMFDSLCELVEGEIALQHALLSLCEAQHRAIRALDFEYIEAKAADMQELSEQVRDARAARTDMLRAVTEAHGLPSQGVGLDAIVGAAPKRDADRLIMLAGQLQRLQMEVHAVTIGGVLSLQRGADAIRTCMEGFRSCLDVASNGEAKPLPVPAVHDAAVS